MFSASAMVLCPQHAHLTLLFLIVPSSDLGNGREMSFHRFFYCERKIIF